MKHIKNFTTFSEALGKQEAAAQIQERSQRQEEFLAFFKGKLEEFGVGSPAELDDEQKKEFFNQIEVEWDENKTEEGVSTGMHTGKEGEAEAEGDIQNKNT